MRLVSVAAALILFFSFIQSALAAPGAIREEILPRHARLIEQFEAQAQGWAHDYVRDGAGGAAKLAEAALDFLGVRYRYGGTSTSTGLDCSALVQKVAEKAAGIELPRTSAEQAAATERISKSDLKPGDLVFFNTLRRKFSHVGIYIGDGQFVHAPRTGARVRIEDMDTSYWLKRFDGARRLGLH